MKKLPAISKMEEPMELTENIARYIIKLQEAMADPEGEADLPLKYSDEDVSIRRRLESWFPVLRKERLASENQAANRVFKDSIRKLGDEVFKRGGMDTVLSATWDSKLADILRFEQAVDELRGALIRLSRESGAQKADAPKESLMWQRWHIRCRKGFLFGVLEIDPRRVENG